MFNNQTIVITGGASGIGLEVANAVAQNNGTALIIDLSLIHISEPTRR